MSSWFLEQNKLSVKHEFYTFIFGIFYNNNSDKTNFKTIRGHIREYIPKVGRNLRMLGTVSSWSLQNPYVAGFFKCRESVT